MSFRIIDRAAAFSTKQRRNIGLSGRTLASSEINNYPNETRA